MGLFYPAHCTLWTRQYNSDAALINHSSLVYFKDPPPQKKNNTLSLFVLTSDQLIAPDSESVDLKSKHYENLYFHQKRRGEVFGLFLPAEVSLQSQ